MTMSKESPAFTPPARPEWVSIVNREGSVLDINGLVPLDEQSLIASARANTGLSDFGDDDWREPFAVLLKSLNEEARLNLVGRLLTRSDLLSILEARLRVEDLYRRHPEIEDVRIERPLWIVGQGRTGTSILQTLLGLDPINRIPTMWEGLFPVPLPGVTDRRHEVAEARFTQWNRIVPEFASMHEFAADAQTETIQFEALSFRAPGWLNLFGATPSYSAYIADQDYRIPFRYALRVFKAMEWQNPGRRWVMKSPLSLGFIPELLDIFPDALLVWPHRDPIKSLASVLNFIGTLDWMRSDHLRGEGTFQQLVDPAGIAATLSNPISWLKSGVLPEAQLCNILYQDLVAHPVDVIRRIYETFGLDHSPEFATALEDYVRANPRDARPPHSYRVGDKAEIDEQRAMFKAYQQHFDVPSEV